MVPIKPNKKKMHLDGNKLSLVNSVYVPELTDGEML